jgi:GTPase SAR1 family protein
MEKCTLCNRSEASYICVCEETTVCGPCLLSHHRSSPHKSHRPVPISHPLLSLMQDANYSIKTFPSSSAFLPIPDQIKNLEKIRDQHYAQMTEKIDSLKFQLNQSINTNMSQSPVRSHRKAQSVSFQRNRKYLTINSLKIVILGAQGVGKSTLESSFFSIPVTSRQDFSSRISKSFVIGEQRVSINVAVVPWDKGNLRNSYFFRAKGIVFVFDLRDRSTLGGLDRAVKEVWAEVKKKIMVFVIGSKIDLAEQNKNKVVEKEEMESVVSKYGGMYFELNLLDENQVQTFFKVVAEKVCEDDLLT